MARASIACLRIAEQLDDVVDLLDDILELSNSIIPYRASIDSLIFELIRCARLLQVLSDDIINNWHSSEECWSFFEAILPCMRMTIEDIQFHLHDTSVTYYRRWHCLCQQMQTEAGTSLRGRFTAYGIFLTQLSRWVRRSRRYDRIALRDPLTILRNIREYRQWEGK